ncbi:MAG: choice-of-anchor D domain-containing protein [Bacteroidota bacterium]
MKNNLSLQIKKTTILTILVFALSNLVNAQVFVATYPFASVTATSGTTDPTPVSTATGVVFGSVTSIGASTNSSAAGRFSFAGWGLGATASDNVYANLTGSISTSQYYEITITPAVGYSISLTDISFRAQRSGTGIRTYAVRSSIDTYGANLPASISPANANLSVETGNIFFWMLDATTSGQAGSFVTLGASHTNLTTPVTFRFYGWNAEGAGGTFSIDDVIFNGSANLTTPMPEINVKQNTTNVLNNSTYNFGTTPDGSSLISNFTIENNGTAPLQITSATFTGSTDFTVNTTLPLTISASSSTTFSTTFSPSSVGTLTASIAFDNDDSDENPYTINFVGNSIAAIPEINVMQNTNTFLSGSTYTFAPILAGNTSIATFTIQNIGGATLNITSTTFAGNPDISVTSDYSAPFSIAYGDFATFTATFSPSVVNTYSASITLSNDDSDENQYVINFYGEATAPFSEINIKQASTNYANGTTYSFGNKAVSSTTDIVFTIENLGNSVLNISTYTLSGSEFSLQGAMPTSVNAGATADFTIRFVPTSATTFSGSISLTNNDGNENPYLINFAGAGITAPSEINVKESGINYFAGTTYDFANRTVGTNSDVTFTIENNDSGVLLISTHTLTGSAYSIVGTIPSSINGNSTANFTLRFSPLTAVAYTGSLTLVNNDANESSYVINLTGNGIALPATPSLKINEIMANPSSGDDWFEIYNPGSSAVNLSGLYVSNSTSAKYKFVSGSPSIPAGGFVQVMANNGGQISPLEVNFTLSNTDEVFLYSYDGTTLIDQLAVTDAVADQSQGRVTDGGAEFMSFSTATPGATNTAGVGVVSVRELSKSEKLILAPNPSSAVFTISYANLSNEKTFAYRVIDITGKEVLSGNTNAVSGLNIYPVDVTSIAKGLYFVECVVGNEKVTNKIVVE